jgi:unsaturated rhamnogalacturonyl hydrolase
LAKVEDPQTGTFWQVLDAAKRDKNYREASATAMIAYAIGKAAKQGWLEDKQLGAVASAAYRGTLEQFVEVDSQGRLALKQSTNLTGPGDGSYEFYTGSKAELGEPAGLGAFVKASLARE